MSIPLRVLIAEDREDDALLLLRELRRGGYDVTWERVESREGMREALDARTWDLIVSDFRMPSFEAPEALALCRERGIEAPFIIVSSTVSEEQAVESMKAGAHDFVPKGRFARLCPAVDRGLRELEERRARARAEAELRQAQKMEAIGQLAGGVAHDFNNILGVVTGHCDLLRREMEPSDPRRHRVDEIQTAATKAASLTHQLLAFGRRQVLQPVVVDLNALVAEVEAMLRRLIREDIQVVSVLAEGLGRVKADPGQLEQVILNLALNARDAMPSGGKLIIETRNVLLDEEYARSRAGVKSGDYVMLAVSDTGIGMDADTRSHIFEPFFTTKEAGKGTGLGLATAYGIVKQSGGHVAVYSELDHGTTFRIYLPRCDAPAQRMAPSASAEAAPRGAETLLLLEDEDALRLVIAEVLEESGYKVITAAVPEEALQAGLSHPGRIDLLLTDVVMPKVSGRDAFERLKAAQPKVRALYMSGYTNEVINHNGVLDAGTKFIQKPFAFDALLHKIREVIEPEP
jgi:two-component system, cell cycle sensor histidine kinase and response regulator CckA